MSLNFEISDREILRYLGYKNVQVDEQTLKLISECKDEICKNAVPRSYYQRFLLSVSEDDEIKIGNLVFVSKNLSKNLRGCSEVILFAATLGPEVDMFIKRYAKINLSKAVVYNAAAIAAIEAYCDDLQLKIGKEVSEEGLFLRPRFSPGYGDVPLEIQKDFLKEISASKTVGITLLEGNLMIPEKSVSAFIGLSFENSHCLVQGCEVCKNTECQYRR